ncbi:MAG: hypothetical protein ABIK82_12395 [Pseudomonadota bacterium]
MRRTELNEKALKGASQNAQKAIDAVCAEEFSAIHAEEKVAWAMAAMIHCDICRLVVAFDECEREGIARLLWMADIASKLHEAKRWYLENGGKLLCSIARGKNCGETLVRARIKEIKAKYPIRKVEAYSDYRNRFGYHYDADALTYLRKFGNEDADVFFEMLAMFARFSGDWAQLTSALIKDDL